MTQPTAPGIGTHLLDLIGNCARHCASTLHQLRWVDCHLGGEFLPLAAVDSWPCSAASSGKDSESGYLELEARQSGA